MGYVLGTMCPQPTPNSSPKRDDLVRTAADLFCGHGIHAVGIDRIIEEAGVAKATLYKHFPCKDDLVVASLRETSDRGQAALLEAVHQAGPDPRHRFLALPAIIAHSTEHGCVFVLAAQEFPDRSHAVHKEAAAHKRAMRRLFGRLSTEAGSTLEPAEAGTRIQLILDGVYAAVALGPADAKRATEAAVGLLADHLSRLPRE
ncbi:MAG: AcrR family transcriptional regulator [Planctomycetota bacterium]